MARQRKPVPQTAGQLVPPPRRPPTAVGAATPPPPPRYRPGDYSRHRRPIERIAQGLLGTTCLAGGVAAFFVAAPVTGVACSLIGIQALARAATGSGPLGLLLRHLGHPR